MHPEAISSSGFHLPGLPLSRRVQAAHQPQLLSERPPSQAPNAAAEAPMTVELESTLMLMRFDEL